MEKREKRQAESRKRKIEDRRQQIESGKQMASEGRRQSVSEGGKRQAEDQRRQIKGGKRQEGVNLTRGNQRGRSQGENERQKVRPAAAPGRETRHAPAPCPAFKKCGGCQMLDLPYEEQLRRKQQNVERLLKEYCKVGPIVGMEEPFHYRNKVHAVFGFRKGEIISGVYQEGSHEIVPVKSCMIEDEKADAIIATVRELAKSFKIRTYDEDTGYGLLRHVLVKRGFATGEIMVVLVMAAPVFPSRNHFVKALRERHPEITTVIQNQNDRATSMVLGDKERVLFGKGYIEDELCGYRFRISSRSFYQVNPLQTEKLYAKAMELAGLTGQETVIDAYCGTGTIGIIASARAGRVIGVELNADAVRDAAANAKRNHVENIQFYQNDASAFMVGMAQQGERADVIFLDPPRSGSTEEFIRAAAALKPSRVMYISCNPETLARDLKVFRQFGYRADGAWPYDLFPQTEHVETVCLLSKLNVKQHIEVELTMDEMDLTAAEKKASYEEIKEYVLEKFGMKVSHLYIAQVKRKCGIIERENYNKPKSESAKQPQCPPEKEAAIREALEYFKMI